MLLIRSLLQTYEKGGHGEILNDERPIGDLEANYSQSITFAISLRREVAAAALTEALGAGANPNDASERFGRYAAPPLVGVCELDRAELAELLLNAGGAA